MSARPLHFNAFIWPNGYHESAWRVVDDDVHNVLVLSYYTDIARIAERGSMDSSAPARGTSQSRIPLAKRPLHSRARPRRLRPRRSAANPSLG